MIGLHDLVTHMISSFLHNLTFFLLELESVAWYFYLIMITIVHLFKIFRKFI